MLLECDCVLLELVIFVRKVSCFATDICVAVYVGAMCWSLLAPLT
jgi:hypothetical protein